MKTKKKVYIKKLITSFIIKIILLTICVPSILFMIIRICAGLDFNELYRTFPNFYDFAKKIFMNLYYDNLFFALITFIIWALLFTIILVRFAHKVIKYYETIVSSYDDILDNKEEYITLPSEMSEIENKINVIKHSIDKNERSLRESEQKKDDLVVYLAHDIKTPLTSMIGYLSLLDEEKDLNKKQREKYIQIALDKSYKIEDLINELFDITRFNSEKLILEKEDLDLKLLLEQIVDDFYPVLLECHKKIKLNIKDKIIIDADSNKIARVFNNVIKNAISYGKENSAITINVDTLGRKAIIDIINAGKEIPKEKLDKLFDKFYRLDSARSSKSGGSGLGLAIAKEIVKMHGGEIKAISQGKEMTFHIELPLA